MSRIVASCSSGVLSKIAWAPATRPVRPTNGQLGMMPPQIKRRAIRFQNHVWTPAVNRTLRAGSPCSAERSRPSGQISAPGPRPDRGELDVIGFRHPDAEFLHQHRIDFAAVGGHDIEKQARNADIERRHRRSIDEPQPHLFAECEKSGPVGGRRLAIDEEGVGRARHIHDVGRAHPHAAPHRPVGPGDGEAVAFHITDEVARRSLMEIIVVALLSQVADDRHWIFVCPVGQEDHVIAVPIVAGFGSRLQHQGAVEAGLLLQAGVAVIPIGPGLDDRETVREGLAGHDPAETRARHAVHIRRQAQAVPVDRRRLHQMVGDPRGHGVALAKAQSGTGHGPVHHRRHSPPAGDVHLAFTNGQVKSVAAEVHFGGDRREAQRRRAPKGRHTLDEASSGYRDRAANWRFRIHPVVSARRAYDDYAPPVSIPPQKSKLVVKARPSPFAARTGRASSNSSLMASRM